MHRRLFFLTALIWTAVTASAQAIKYDFSSGPAKAGWTKVAPDAAYSDAAGFGFEGAPGVLPTAYAGGVKATAPFFFTFKVPAEGNWRVTVTLGGDPDGPSLTTISAEIRRLMVLHAATKPGETKTVSFLVNTRTPKLPDGRVVRLKPRETQGEAMAWDDKIQLEFNDAHPAIGSITAERADNVPTVYLLGDSTMTDQPGMPTTSWGNFLPIFFKNNVVAIANHGESGEAYSAFRGELRLAKVLSVIKPGDWVISQFGHNDEKERERGPEFGAFKNYATEMRNYTREFREKGAHIILVTPMQRHEFADGKVKNTHDDYPDAVRAVAKELDVPLIDLTLMSDKMMTTLGEKDSWLLFSRGQDATHHDPYGAWELAKCIVQGIKDAKVEPTKWIVDDFAPFDPAKPDPIASFTVPASPRRGPPPGGPGGPGGPRAGQRGGAPAAAKPVDDPSKPYGN